MNHALQEETLIEKIRMFPPERVAEGEDFIDFLRHQDDDRRLTQAADKPSEESLRKVWDNEDDAAYDDL